MVIWIARRGSRATIPAPNHAPAAALTTSDQQYGIDDDGGDENERFGERGGSVVRRSGCPESVRSGTMRRNLNIAVVGAKEPMPKVSKKSATNPHQDFGRGRPTPVPRRRAARIAPMTKATAARPRAMYRAISAAFMDGIYPLTGRSIHLAGLHVHSGAGSLPHGQPRSGQLGEWDNWNRVHRFAASLRRSFC